MLSPALAAGESTAPGGWQSGARGTVSPLTTVTSRGNFPSGDWFFEVCPTQDLGALTVILGWDAMEISIPEESA
jgi:hypothetical protein